MICRDLPGFRRHSGRRCIARSCVDRAIGGELEELDLIKTDRTDPARETSAGRSVGRAVASDFDNTLYFMEDEEPLRAADIFGIVYYQQRGGLFGICTGRSLTGVSKVIFPFIRPDFYIVASGALVLDGDENVLFKKCLPLEIVKSIYDRYEKSYEMVIQANDSVYTFGESWELMPHIDSFEELKDADVYGISIAAPDIPTAAAVTEEIRKIYGDEAAVYHNVTHIDVAPSGCSKGSGIEVVRRAFNIREMYGIGDSFNDLPLLQSVDHPFTLTHAPAKVQEAAEKIVRSVSELLDRI